MSGSGKCKECQRDVVWAVSQRGRRIPWDIEPSERGTHVLVPDLHNGAVSWTSRLPRKRDGKSPKLYTCHFLSCPAKQRRTKE
jgi:hypothetical protein